MHAVKTRLTKPTTPTSKPTPAGGTLDDLIRAIAADPEAGAWSQWAFRLLADEQAAVAPTTECAKSWDLKGGVA